MTANGSKPRWYRRYLQFSLRTMLIATTLAAVGCWWFLRPQSHDEPLAGNYLKLRRQVRLNAKLQQQADPFTDPLESIGFWRVRDQHDRLLVDGRYAQNQPHGEWVLYHSSGHKAASGEMQRGCRTGLWRTWDANGTLRSEVTYRVVKLPAPRPVWHTSRPSPGLNSVIPVVGMTSPLLQIDYGGFACGTFGCTYWGGGPVVEYVSERHGPARGWHANSQPQFAGHYDADHRAGVWTYYDEQGQATERGEYQDDRREGKWTIHDPATGRDHKVKYITGRKADEHEQWLAARRADVASDNLASDNLARQIAAIQQLATLGERSRPIIADLLADPRDEVKLLALRTLLDHDALSEDMLPRIEPLIDHADERLALRARLAAYLLSPQRRGSFGGSGSVERWRGWGHFLVAS